MGRQGDRQRGFSIVEAVLVVAVVGIIGVGGWFVYQHNRTQVTDAATGSTQPANQQTTSTTPAPNVVKLPELGIQISVPNGIKDLTYQVSTITLRSGQTETLAKFSTQSLTSADSACSASFGPLGSLGKVDGQYPSSDPNAGFYYGNLVKQFPTFFIVSGAPNAGCSNKQNVTSDIGVDKDNFVTALSTIQVSN